MAADPVGDSGEPNGPLRGVGLHERSVTKGADEPGFVLAGAVRDPRHQCDRLADGGVVEPDSNNRVSQPGVGAARFTVEPRDEFGQMRQGCLPRGCCGCLRSLYRRRACRTEGVLYDISQSVNSFCRGRIANIDNYMTALCLFVTSGLGSRQPKQIGDPVEKVLARSTPSITTTFRKKGTLSTS